MRTIIELDPQTAGDKPLHVATGVVALIPWHDFKSAQSPDGGTSWMENGLGAEWFDLNIIAPNGARVVLPLPELYSMPSPLRFRHPSRVELVPRAQQPRTGQALADAAASQSVTLLRVQLPFLLVRADDGVLAE